MTGVFIKIIIADDHELFREGFKAMIRHMPEARVIGEAENGEMLLTLTEKLQPDLVFMDIAMPKINGIEATKKITAQSPHIRVIALSMFDDENSIVDMLEAGAKGYLVKNAHKTEIMQAIKTVYAGNNYFCKLTTSRLAQLIANNRYHPHRKMLKTEFTTRELEIIALVARGLSSKEIAATVNLTPRTVESYREKIMQKMEVNNTAELIIYAIKHRLYKPE